MKKLVLILSMLFVASVFYAQDYQQFDIVKERISNIYDFYDMQIIPHNLYYAPFTMEAKDKSWAVVVFNNIIYVYRNPYSTQEVYSKNYLSILNMDLPDTWILTKVIF